MFSQHDELKEECLGKIRINTGEDMFKCGRSKLEARITQSISA